MRYEGVLFAILFTSVGCLDNRCLELGECHMPDSNELLYPLTEGAWWRMQVQYHQGLAFECPNKVVSVGPERRIPLRPDVEAYQVFSVREDEWGIRWQEVREDSSIVRHVDEWYRLPYKEFPDARDRTSIKYYCPYKERAMDGDKACICGDWERTHWQLTITLNSNDCSDWEICEAIAVDPFTCAPISGVPDVCQAEFVEVYEEFVVEAVDAQVETVWPGGPLSALQVYCLEETSAGETGWDVYSWHRGIGKIAKDDGEDWDTLVDFCLPDANGETKDTCATRKPTTQQLRQKCPWPGPGTPLHAEPTAECQ